MQHVGLRSRRREQRCQQHRAGVGHPSRFGGGESAWASSHAQVLWVEVRFRDHRRLQYLGRFLTQRCASPIRGYRGQASSLGEYRYASALGRTIERGSGLPRVLRFFVSDEDARRYGHARVEIRFAPAFVRTDEPQNHTPVTRFAELPRACQQETMDLISGGRTVILVGSAVYNPAVLYVNELVKGKPGDLGVWLNEVDLPGDDEDTRRTHRAICTKDEDFIRDQVTGKDGHTYNREYCLIQRVQIASEGGAATTVFLCSGFSTVATVAGLDQLNDWRRLQRDVVGDGPFAAVYEVRAPSRELLTDRLSSDVRVKRVYLYPAKDEVNS